MCFHSGVSYTAVSVYKVTGDTNLCYLSPLSGREGEGASHQAAFGECFILASLIICKYVLELLIY